MRKYGYSIAPNQRGGKNRQKSAGTQRKKGIGFRRGRKEKKKERRK